MFVEQRNDRCLKIVLNHGAVNAMDLEFCSRLTQRFQELADDPEISAVVISGNNRVFSAGIDLKRWLAEGPGYVEPFMLSLEQLFQTVFCFPKPVVSAITGPAIAGGCMLATASDVRLIGSSAKIGILESRLGVPLPMTAIEIVRHVASPAAFRKMITVGATYLGRDAVSAGLADSCSDELEPLTSRSVEELTAIPCAAFELTKKQVRSPVMRIVERNKAELFDQYLQIWKSQQTRDTIAAYVQQRLS